MWLRFNAKEPGAARVVPKELRFAYRERNDAYFPEAYERLIADALAGDSTLFIRADEADESWRIIDALEAAWASVGPARPLRGRLRGPRGPDRPGLTPVPRPALFGGLSLVACGNIIVSREPPRSGPGFLLCARRTRRGDAGGAGVERQVAIQPVAHRELDAFLAARGLERDRRLVRARPARELRGYEDEGVQVAGGDRRRPFRPWRSRTCPGRWYAAIFSRIASASQPPAGLGYLRYS